MRRFVSVDLETTGVDFEQDYIVEVGIAGERLDGSYFETAFSLDFPDGAMSEGAAKVNGWGKRQFAPIVTYSYAVGYLHELLNDVHIIGKNPHFDEAFLRRFYLAHWASPLGYPASPPWHHRLVDIGSLAWGYGAGLDVMEYGVMAPRLNTLAVPPNVEEVERMMGIPREKVDGFHTALCDARWNYEVFRSIVPKGD